ncbi:MAG: TraR/DksA family transcriptional regulator [Elusimicrobiota bacterium]|jgi:DnaK suppressor protein|nr:TraR/DksA family transcriptional regulator [Elusimicrobiota bacterium]
MTKKDLATLKKILIQKKAELLNKPVSEIDDNIGDEMDMASNSAEKELYYTLVSEDKITVDAINDAIAKVEAGNYGNCECCSSKIPIERLKAIPWTRYCIRCQEESEATKR